MASSIDGSMRVLADRLRRDLVGGDAGVCVDALRRPSGARRSATSSGSSEWTAVVSAARCPSPLTMFSWSRYGLQRLQDRLELEAGAHRGPASSSP